MSGRPRFHLAFPVRDLAEARAFYGGLLKCEEGRSSAEWVDFDFFGHQIVAHLSPACEAKNEVNRVDGEVIPVRHFGVVLDLPEWRELSAHLKAKGARFLINPCVRFEGQKGEQATFFIADSSGNALEFKAFATEEQILRVEASTIAGVLGGIALGLMLGALGFQVLDHLPPCEMCMWQRWPLIAAIVVGLGGGLIRGRAAAPFALLALMLVGASGAIGAYQAGIEWHWWAGPSACTGARIVVQVGGDLNAPIVRCDVAAWRLFGISLAGYNALICLGAASIASVFLLRSQR